MTSSQTITGIPAAPGLASGSAFVWKEVELVLPEPYPCANKQAAWEEVRTAIDQAKTDLVAIRERVEKKLGKGEAAIFDAHLMMVEDVALLDMVRTSINNGINPEAAWKGSIDAFAGMLENLTDPILSARAMDVRDVGRRVLAFLLGTPLSDNTLDKPCIVIARDLTPSQTAMMDHRMVLAFCTSAGGPTSHTAILSKALGIPAIVGLGDSIMNIKSGDFLLVDSDRGILTIHPSQEQVDDLKHRKEIKADQDSLDMKTAFQPAITRDGIQVEIFANIGSRQDAELAVRLGAEGVGLFRTEFLYLNRSSMPDLSLQTEIYKQVIETLDGRPLVVRTLDIGGDKQVDYLGITSESNPFLGWRGIRMIFERPEILAGQFHALLKAGWGTDLRIMLPMVARIEEVELARTILEQTLNKLQQEEPSFEIQLQFGIMIEVPSAALMVEHLAPLVDFFSIGTNDLTQYTLAMDRANARVASNATPFHPAVLKLIERTIRKAHECGKWVGMCGEFAGDPAAIPFLVGVELDEFSMSPALIPQAKRIIRKLSRTACRDVALKTLQMARADEVEDYLRSVVPE